MATLKITFAVNENYEKTYCNYLIINRFEG